MKTLKAIMATTLLVFGFNAHAAGEFIAQGRLFLGSTQQPGLSEVNASLRADGMATYPSVGQYGVEITYPLKNFLNVGMRYHKTHQVAYEEPASSATNYEAELIQDEVMLLARVPIVKSGSLYFDVFAGVGGTNTSYEIRSATQNGELTKKEANDWFASPMGAAGASVGVGYNSVYAFLEAGYEYNKVSGFKREGTINNSIQEIDFSGSYILIGVMFDGIKAFQK